VWRQRRDRVQTVCALALDKRRIRSYITGSEILEEIIMAHKKVERKKEIDRRRQRREQRLKARSEEAKAAAGK